MKRPSKMSRYSPEGYLIRLRMLKRKTLLVEGVKDKRVVSRVIMELEKNGLDLSRLVVDTAELISSDGRVIGNREKVEQLHSMAWREELPLGAFVDREYRQFDIADLLDLLNCHNVVSDTLFWTRGHSVENYFIAEGMIRRFLEFQFPEHVGASICTRVGSILPDILTHIAAVSIAAYEGSLISRLSGIWRTAHWGLDPNDHLQLEDRGFLSSLIERGVDSGAAEGFLSRVSDLRSLAQGREEGILRWISHGHIATEALWTAVGKFLESKGVDQEIVRQTAHGYAELKMRIAADFWAEQVAAQRAESPEALWQWAAQAA
jgi:predicted aconitase with swiveling domain